MSSSSVTAVVPPLVISLEEYAELQAQVSELSFSDACYELLECSRYGELDAVRAILELHPSSINTTTTTDDSCNNTTALHKACANGHTSVVELLLRQGNAKLVSNASGNTPLHWAAANGHHEIVFVLLQHYNNEEIDVLQKNSFGRSALTEGFGSKSTETAKFLLEHDSASEEKLLAGGKELNDEEVNEQNLPKNSIIHEFCFGSNHLVKIQELPIATNDENNPLGDTAVEDTTGLGIWCASLVMAQWMADLSKEFQNKTIVELGAGCGVPGLTIASSTKEVNHVYVTDLNPMTVQNLQTNIDLNSVQEKVTALTMDWDDESTWPITNNNNDDVVVIGSDLIYQKSIVPLLKQVVLGLLSSTNGGTFYYVAPDTGRDGLDEFINDMSHELDVVSKTVAPKSYYTNPLQSKDEEEAFLHFHELSSSTFILYEFRTK